EVTGVAGRSGELLLPPRLVADPLRLPRRAAVGGEGTGRDPLDQMVLLQPVRDEVADGAGLQTVGTGEIHEVVEAGHGPVLAQNLADDARGVEAGEARDIDSGLGVTGA